MMKPFLIALGVLFSSAALAHQGTHGHLDILGVLAHIFEPDHVIFAAIAIVSSVLAYRAGRRAEARAIAKRGERHDPR